MDIRQLKYFLAVAEEGQITAAAKRLHITQPPLSQQLKLLENELGVILFERGSREVTLTKAGNILRDRAEQIIELTNAAAKELKDLNKGVKGTINIGTVASCDIDFLPKVISEFHINFPDVDFQVWEGDTFRISELLSSGIVEIGLIRTPFNFEGYESILFPGDPMIAAANSNWSLDNFDTVKLETLHDKSIIIHRRYEKSFTSACEKHGFEPKLFCKSDNIRSMLTWADNGLGIAVVPKSTINVAKSMSLIIKEIDDELLNTTVAVVWMKKRYLSTAAREFINNFKQQLKK